MRSGGRLGISWAVNRAKQILALLVLANWFACIVHCQAERCSMAGFGTGPARVVCHVASQAADGEECPGICDWVVTGGCKAAESRVEAPEWFAVQVAPLPGAGQAPKQLAQDQGALVEWSTARPERADTFLFYCRTALPPRAPSFVA